MKAQKQAIRAESEKIVMGIGYFTSATKGAEIVMILAKRLQKPKAVAENSGGKKLGVLT